MRQKITKFSYPPSKLKENAFPYKMFEIKISLNNNINNNFIFKLHWKSSNKKKKKRDLVYVLSITCSPSLLMEIENF